jgi:hypothetical protein
MGNPAIPMTWRVAGAVGALTGMRALKPAAKSVLLGILFSRADAFVASYPKSGRTWLRFVLANYLNDVFELGLDVDFHTMFRIIPNSMADKELGWGVRRARGRSRCPFLVASHDPYQRALFFGRPIVFIVRDPRDVLVSRYFHKSRHYRDFDGNMKAFLRSEELGVPDYARYLNGWAKGLEGHRHLAIAYEHMSRTPASVVGDVLRFLTVDVDPDALARAIDASTFESMRALEVRDGLPTRDYERDQEVSLRVRRGKVGGYIDYLDPDDVTYVEQSCAAWLSDEAKGLLTSVDIRLEAPRQPADTERRMADAAAGGPVTMSSGQRR